MLMSFLRPSHPFFHGKVVFLSGARLLPTGLGASGQEAHILILFVAPGSDLG